MRDGGDGGGQRRLSGSTQLSPPPPPPPHIQTQVCGVTNAADAAHAVRCGANFIGAAVLFFLLLASETLPLEQNQQKLKTKPTQNQA